MVRFLRLSIAMAVLALAGAGPALAQDPIINYRRADTEMNAAIEKAVRTLPTFLEALNAAKDKVYAVKVPIPHEGGREHIWMDQVRLEGSEFVGRIANEPVHLKTITKGSPYRVAQAGISDWYFVRDGKMHGAWTIRVMIPRMRPEEAQRTKRMLAP